MNIEKKKSNQTDTNAKNMLKDKDMEIKKLKEMIVELKVKTSNSVMDLDNSKKLATMRVEMKKADMFIKEVMKFDIEMMVKSENLDVIPVMKKMEKTVKSDIRDMFFHPTSCICTMCIAYRTCGMFDLKKKTQRLLIGSGVSLEMVYNPSNFKTNMATAKEGEKSMTFHSREHKDNDIKLTFLKKSERIPIEMNLRENLTIPVEIFGGKMEVLISMSSMIIVTAFRNQVSPIETSMEGLDLVKVDQKMDCFSKMLKKIFDLEELDREILCISDLTWEEESALLSLAFDYNIFYQRKSMNHSQNHISFESFEGATEITMKMLILNEMRITKFYNDEFERSKIEIPATEVLSDTTMPEDMAMAEERSIVSMTELGRGTLCSLEWEDAREELVKNMSNRSFTKEVLEKLVKCSMGCAFFRKNIKDPFLIRAWYMTEEEFSAIAHFSGSLKKLSDMVFTESINSFKQTLSILPKIVFENLSIEADEKIKLTKEEFQILYMKVLKTIKDWTMDEFEFIQFCYWSFKYRVMMIIISHAHSDEVDNLIKDKKRDLKEDFEAGVHSDLDMDVKLAMDVFLKKIDDERMMINKFQPNSITFNWFKMNQEEIKTNLDIEAIDNFQKTLSNKTFFNEKNMWKKMKFLVSNFRDVIRS
jgi:hypothetical protein